MGRIAKGAKCSVIGCDKEAVRSLSTKRVSVTSLKVNETRRSCLCKDHYKQFKKQIKKETMLERWRYKG